MITRERLEELISQRATIYSTDWDEAVELSPETCTVENIKILWEFPKRYPKRKSYP